MPSILIIDDEPEVAALLRDLLENAGYRVSVARSGREDLALQRANPVELVTTDIYMPHQDGIETILELRQEFPRVKILAISGGGTAVQLDLLPAAHLLGAHRVLPKPVDPTEFLATVGQLVGVPACGGPRLDEPSTILRPCQVDGSRRRSGNH